MHLYDEPKWPKVAIDSNRGDAMLSMSAKDAKYGFGRLIDLARAGADRLTPPSRKPPYPA